MDKFQIDSHKLIYHPQRVSDWFAGKNIYPIYMELSPTSACNHRCVFCGLDFAGHKKQFLDTARLDVILKELGALGIKSIMYAGEGEPFLHKDMVDIIKQTRNSGIDAAVTTNGVLMTPEVSEQIMGLTEWIKVSCNAGTPETYSKIHRTSRDDFDTVLENLRHAVEIKRKKNYACTLGAQILLLPENEDEIEKLAVEVRTIGIDYLVVKPYSQHPQSRTEKYKNIKYLDGLELAARLKGLNTKKFNLVFRLASMENWDNQVKGYARCLALPFWSYIDAAGNVWGCSVYLMDDRFLYGNIYEENFEAIWNGDRRRRSLEWVRDHLDAQFCRVNCRMDSINRYLHALKSLPPHVNFI